MNHDRQQQLTVESRKSKVESRYHVNAKDGFQTLSSGDIGLLKLCLVPFQRNRCRQERHSYRRGPIPISLTVVQIYSIASLFASCQDQSIEQERGVSDTRITRIERPCGCLPRYILSLRMDMSPYYRDTFCCHVIR